MWPLKEEAISGHPSSYNGVRIRFTEVRAKEKPRVKGRWDKLR